ncbi:Molybdopterin synthase sulfur carrier subunit [Tenacibaculum litopenaei]|jgi:molybdopterin converting factor small subunit|uniref:MoaD/ThiS family protein n=1 Tax=Tenacibaculum litopenaei TaxID=396016 RepID=UPI0038967891
MKVAVLTFGITRDIVGSNTLTMEVPDNCSLSVFKSELYKKYPAMEALKSLAFAINEVYAQEQSTLAENDTIALIPPVSGG